MKLVLSLAEPRDGKERLYRATAEVNELCGRGWIVVGGREYLVEVEFEVSREFASLQEASCSKSQQG